MKIKRDYLDFNQTTELGSDGIYTVSLSATFGTKKEAESFANDLELVKEQLQSRLE